MASGVPLRDGQMPQGRCDINTCSVSSSLNGGLTQYSLPLLHSCFTSRVVEDVFIFKLTVNHILHVSYSDWNYSFFWFPILITFFLAAIDCQFESEIREFFSYIAIRIPSISQVFILVSRFLMEESLTRIFISILTMPQRKLSIVVTSFPINRPAPTRHAAMELIDCSRLQPPSPALCNRFTGLEPEIDDAVFSNRTTNLVFADALSALKYEIRHWDFRNGRCLVVPVACLAGVHRSVAMTERIACAISAWRRSPLLLLVKVRHENLWRHVEKHRRDSRANRKRFIDLRDRVCCDHNGTVKRFYDRGLPYNVDPSGSCYSAW